MAETNKKLLSYYMSLDYPIELTHHTDHDEPYWFAEIADMNGCMADGGTPDEAVENLREAKERWIETSLEQGMPIPEPSDAETYSGRLLLRLPKTLHGRLAKDAKRDGVSLNTYLVSLLSESSGQATSLSSATRQTEEAMTVS